MLGATTPLRPPSSIWIVKSVALRRCPPILKGKLPVGLIERWITRGSELIFECRLVGLFGAQAAAQSELRRVRDTHRGTTAIILGGIAQISPQTLRNAPLITHEATLHY